MSIQSTGRLSLLVTAALAAAPMVLMAAPALPRLDSITPDGDLADWGTGGLHLPFLAPDSPRLPDPTKSGVAARFAWDDKGLLVAIEVTDTTPHEAELAAAAYTADSVELFLGLDPAKPDNVQLVLSPGHDPAHPKPRFYVFVNTSSAGDPQSIASAWAVKPKADGYVVEARLPWAAAGIRPAPGLTVATRLYVNDDDGTGTRTRHVWQPEANAGRFHALTLSDKADPGSIETPAVWTSLDVAETAGRVNLIAAKALDGTAWQVRRGDDLLGTITLRAAGNAASGTLTLPVGGNGTSDSLTLAGPGDATLTVRDNFAEQAAGLVARANGGRGGPGPNPPLAYARAEFPAHVFDGPAFPTLNFVDPSRVERLLGAAPVVATRWLDAEGRDVTAPNAPGLYAARSEIKLPGRPNPLILEHILYRVASADQVPTERDQAAATVLAFDLKGADTTPTHIARVAERWWHGVRRSKGWSEALPYKIHVPEGDAARPRPLIVHLHGSGQHSEQAVGERLPLLVEQAGPEPIIVWPQSPGGWRGPAVGELIDALAKKYPIDPSRIYLIGFSLGGIGSWEVALDQPDRFAAVVPIGGRMGSPADAARLKNVPIWVFNGADDPTTTTADAQIMADAIRSAGGNPRFTALPDTAHGDSQDKAYRYPGMFKWMLEQRRDR